MEDLKFILLLLFLLPGVALGQTVHVEKGKIVYKGKMEVKDPKKEDFYNKATKVMLVYVNKEKDSLKIDKEKKEVASKGELRLPTTYRLIRTLCYTIKLNAKEDDLKYQIDDIYLKERERGGK